MSHYMHHFTSTSFCSNLLLILFLLLLLRKGLRPETFNKSLLSYGLSAFVLLYHKNNLTNNLLDCCVHDLRQQPLYHACTAAQSVARHFNVCLQLFKLFGQNVANMLDSQYRKGLVTS